MQLENTVEAKFTSETMSLEAKRDRKETFGSTKYSVREYIDETYPCSVEYQGRFYKFNPLIVLYFSNLELINREYKIVQTHEKNYVLYTRPSTERATTPWRPAGVYFSSDELLSHFETKLFSTSPQFCGTFAKALSLKPALIEFDMWDQEIIEI